MKCQSQVNNTLVFQLSSTDPAKSHDLPASQLLLVHVSTALALLPSTAQPHPSSLMRLWLQWSHAGLLTDTQHPFGKTQLYGKTQTPWHLCHIADSEKASLCMTVSSGPHSNLKRKRNYSSLSPYHKFSRHNTLIKFNVRVWPPLIAVFKVILFDFVFFLVNFYFKEHSIFQIYKYVFN